jgi:hypothetical protein
MAAMYVNRRRWDQQARADHKPAAAISDANVHQGHCGSSYDARRANSVANSKVKTVQLVTDDRSAARPRQPQRSSKAALTSVATIQA